MILFLYCCCYQHVVTRVSGTPTRSSNQLDSYPSIIPLPFNLSCFVSQLAWLHIHLDNYQDFTSLIETANLHSKQLATTAANINTMSLFSIVISLFLLVSATALQVTPNSPCSQFCFDSSNTNSSETRGDEIVCNDDDFKRKAEGQKFQRCLACLQDSSFKQGNESDQDWFLCK